MSLRASLPAGQIGSPYAGWVIDKAKQLREPAVVVAWAVLMVQLIISWVVFARVLGPQSVAEAGAVAGSRNAAFFTTFVILLLAISTLINPVTKNSRILIMVSGHLLMASFATSLVLLIMSLTGGFDFGAVLTLIGGLLDVAIKLLSALALYWLVDWGRKANSQAAPKQQQLSITADGEGGAPVWQPNQASGLQWTRAGDAASGVAGNSAQFNSGSNWQPATRPQLPQAAAAQQPPAGHRLFDEQSQAAPTWQTAAQIAQGAAPAQQSNEETQARSDGPDWTPAGR